MCQQCEQFITLNFLSNSVLIPLIPMYEVKGTLTLSGKLFFFFFFFGGGGGGEGRGTIPGEEYTEKTIFMFFGTCSIFGVNRIVFRSQHLHLEQ